jgi:hypothetical protein
MKIEMNMQLYGMLSCHLQVLQLLLLYLIYISGCKSTFMN